MNTDVWVWIIMGEFMPIAAFTTKERAQEELKKYQDAGLLWRVKYVPKREVPADIELQS